MKIDSKLKAVAVSGVVLFSLALGSGVAMGMNESIESLRIRKESSELMAQGRRDMVRQGEKTPQEKLALIVRAQELDIEAQEFDNKIELKEWQNGKENKNTGYECDKDSEDNVSLMNVLNFHVMKARSINVKHKNERANLAYEWASELQREAHATIDSRKDVYEWASELQREAHATIDSRKDVSATDKVALINAWVLAASAAQAAADAARADVDPTQVIEAGMEKPWDKMDAQARIARRMANTWR